MSQHCDDPYTVKWLKKKLLDRLGDHIFITSMFGKKDVVVDSQSASDLIQELYSKQNLDPGEQKAEIVKVAAKLIADDIRRVDYDPNVFFCLDDINEEEQIKILPDSLRLFLSGIQSRRTRVNDKYR